MREVVTGLIIRRAADGVARILMALRDARDEFAGLWECSGGKVELADRSKEEALQREIWEELGVDSIIHHLVDSTSMEPPEVAWPFTIFFYRVTIIGEPQPLASSELRWMTAEELKDLPQMPAQVKLMGAIQAEMERPE